MTSSMNVSRVPFATLFTSCPCASLYSTIHFTFEFVFSLYLLHRSSSPLVDHGLSAFEFLMIALHMLILIHPLYLYQRYTIGNHWSITTIIHVQHHIYANARTRLRKPPLRPFGSQNFHFEVDPVERSQRRFN